jgi:hypothetical protein
VGARGRAVDLEERLQDALAVFVRDAGAAVDDDELQAHSSVDVAERMKRCGSNF